MRSSPPPYRESSIPLPLVNTGQVPPKWLCKKCNKIFVDLSEITTHLKLHFDGHFNCLLCRYTLSIDQFATKNRVGLDTHPIWSGSSDIQCILCKQFHNGNPLNVFSHMCTHLFDTINVCVKCLRNKSLKTSISSVESLNIDLKNSNIHNLASELGLFETPNMNKNISQQPLQAPVYTNNSLPYNGFNNNQVIPNATVLPRPHLTKNGYLDPGFLPSNIPRQQHNSSMIHIGAEQNLLCQQSCLSSTPRFSPPSHIRSTSGPQSTQVISQSDISTAKTSILSNSGRHGLPSMTNNSLENLKRLIKRIYLDPAIGITSPLHMEKIHGATKIKKPEVNNSVANDISLNNNDNFKPNSNCEPWFVIQSCSGNFNQFNDIPESRDSILSDNLNSFIGTSPPRNCNKIDSAKQLSQNEKNNSCTKNLFHQPKQIGLTSDGQNFANVYPHITQQLTNIHSNPSHIITHAQQNIPLDKSSMPLGQNNYQGVNNAVANLNYPNRNISNLNQPKRHIENISPPLLCNKVQNNSFNHQYNTYPNVVSQAQINQHSNSTSPTGAKFDTFKNNNSNVNINPLTSTLQCSVPAGNMSLRTVDCTKDQSLTSCGASQSYSNLPSNPYKNVPNLQVPVNIPTTHESDFSKIRQTSVNESLPSANSVSYSTKINSKPNNEKLKPIVQNVNQTQLRLLEPTSEVPFQASNLLSDICTKVSSTATLTQNTNVSRENNLTLTRPVVNESREKKLTQENNLLSNQSSTLNVPNSKNLALKSHDIEINKSNIIDSLQMLDSNNSAIGKKICEDIKAIDKTQNTRINEFGNKSSTEKSDNIDINIGKISCETKNKLSAKNESENILDRDTLISCRCGVCNYAFNTLRDLYSHQVMEHLIVLYTCESCGNQLDLPWFLFLDKNSKFRDCVCKHCSTQFDIPKLDHLNNIMCFLCFKTMNKCNDSHLKDHFDINNECYVCLECQQTFEKKKNLQDHCSEQHFLTCQSCKAKFNRNCTYEKHLTGHENNSHMAYNKNIPVKQQNTDYSEEKSKRRIKSGKSTETKSTNDKNKDFYDMKSGNNILEKEAFSKRRLKKENDIPSKKKKSDMFNCISLELV